MTTKTAAASPTTEPLDRMQRMVMTREDTRRQADALFESGPDVRKKDRALMEKLFVQTPAAMTMAFNLQKKASITSHVDAVLEKLAQPQLTEAQQRYPELLKVASNFSAKPNLAKAPIKKMDKGGTTGEVPVRSDVSGGSA